MVYLAMTAAELQNCSSPPENLGWMACHFSPYGTGLTNVPTFLPPGSLLILNDRTPVHGHDPGRIADTLQDAVEKLQCSGILLDFQRPGSAETAAIVDRILELLCPVCVSAPYAESLDCPIFLPPIPLLETAEEYLSTWLGREIWLELALDGAVWEISMDQRLCHPIDDAEELTLEHFDDALYCHYGIEITSQKASFTLKRTKEDLALLLTEAEKFGVTHAVGLWQELK